MYSYYFTRNYISQSKIKLKIIHDLCNCFRNFFQTNDEILMMVQFWHITSDKCKNNTIKIKLNNSDL